MSSETALDKKRKRSHVRPLGACVPGSVGLFAVEVGR